MIGPYATLGRGADDGDDEGTMTEPVDAVALVVKVHVLCDGTSIISNYLEDCTVSPRRNVCPATYSESHLAAISPGCASPRRTLETV